MKAQSYAGQSAILMMRWGEPLQFHRRPGEFVVTHGRLWLTREGDLDDHVLEPGHRVVVEPWQRGERTVIAWRASPQSVFGALPRAAAAFGLRGLAAAADALAGGLRRVAGALAAFARSAASNARRAHGCICAGESSASAGALQ